MLSKGIATELRWLAFVVIAASVVGYSFGDVKSWLIAALFLYIFWCLYRVKELELWVGQARKSSPPADDFGGVWGEIADDVRLLCRKYDKEKVRLQAIVQRVQDMTSALTDAVILVDSRANIEWWNDAAQTLLRFKEIDRGQRLINLIRHPRFISYFESGSYDNPLELESLLKEQQHLKFLVHPFGAGERLIVVRDVTRMKRLEQMRKDFVSNVSHELRTPLTVIRGYIETLLDVPDLPQKWRGAIEQMGQQSHRMSALVNDLMTLSRMETDENEQSAEHVPLRPLINTIIADAEALSNGSHEIMVSGGDDIDLLGDARELHSAISNLVFNAVKYSPNGGTISVTIKTYSDACAVRVQDEGLGIDPKHIPRLTERFYRVDEGRSTSMGGTGLGLAIVKHVLMRHDGELKISSRPGKGSCFSCRFPRERFIQRQAA